MEGSDGFSVARVENMSSSGVRDRISSRTGNTEDDLEAGDNEFVAVPLSVKIFLSQHSAT